MAALDMILSKDHQRTHTMRDIELMELGKRKIIHQYGCGVIKSANQSEGP